MSICGKNNRFRYAFDMKKHLCIFGKGVLFGRSVLRLGRYDEGSELVKERACIIGMRSEEDGVEKVKAENTHDGFCINHIASGREINFNLGRANDLNKIANVLDSGQADISRFHENSPLYYRYLTYLLYQ